MADNSFENKLERMMNIAETLDAGGVSLSESLKLYEEAVKTAKEMQVELDTVKGEIIIMKKELESYIESEAPDDEF